MLRITIDHPEEPRDPRSWVSTDLYCYTEPSMAAVLPTLTAARDLLARRRRLGTLKTTGVRIEFDCPIMQAAYDLGPEESKIT